MSMVLKKRLIRLDSFLTSLTINLSSRELFFLGFTISCRPFNIVSYHVLFYHMNEYCVDYVLLSSNLSRKDDSTMHVNIQTTLVIHNHLSWHDSIAEYRLEKPSVVQSG